MTETHEGMRVRDDAGGISAQPSVDSLDEALGGPAIVSLSHRFDWMHDEIALDPGVPPQRSVVSRFYPRTGDFPGGLVVDFLRDKSDTQEHRRGMTRGEFARLESERRGRVLNSRGIAYLPIFGGQRPPWKELIADAKARLAGTTIVAPAEPAEKPEPDIGIRTLAGQPAF